VRRPLNAKGAAPQTPEAAVNMNATLACEPPNANLHYFIGRCVVQVGTTFAATDVSASTAAICSVQRKVAHSCMVRRLSSYGPQMSDTQDQLPVNGTPDPAGQPVGPAPPVERRRA